ncbi:MAG: Tat pathway signal protein [Eggerthellaceae bacterium]|nr:Tat pathway signal protein [Eggerthellaceae bacterium]
MGVLHLTSGGFYTLREHAVGEEEGFEIYDVRASSSGMVWMEAAIMEGLWRIYVASLSADLSLGEPQLVEEGDASMEIPNFTIIDDYAYWQCMAPVTNENARREPSSIRCARAGDGKAKTLYDSVGRMSAPLTTYENSIIFSPRHPDATSYCDLMRIDASSGKVLDSLTLPSGMYPHQIAYGATGFSFCFENIYDYGGGISNLGSYTPAEIHNAEKYDDLSWFRFNRTPTTAPCWCGDNWFMVKSNQSVCAVNFTNKVFCSFGVESGCLDWGDFLISSGKREKIVTAMQIDDTDTEGNETKMTQVRVWQALGNTPDASSAVVEAADIPYEANVSTSSSDSDSADQAQ